MRLPIKDISLDQIKKVFEGILFLVPIGTKSHTKEQNRLYMPDYAPDYEGPTHLPEYGNDGTYLPVVKLEYSNGLKQLGTLGSGNHFIELQKGSDDYIYIMIHSGSRNIGYQVARYYNQLAKDLCSKWYVNKKVLTDDLAYLPVKSKEGIQYIEEMEYCVQYARNNRRLMMDNCIRSFVESGVLDTCDDAAYYTFKNSYYDVAHNYAALEHHFGQNVWVHRKGATRAYVDEIGIIPGSQGSKSYIVKGKGNAQSFMSCSHGAGRTMSRTKAIENLKMEDEVRKLDDAGVLLHTISSSKSLDEAPGAYKNITEVMKLQEDLVDIIVELSPLACIKG